MLIAHETPLVVHALAAIATELGFVVGARCSDGIDARDEMRGRRFDIAMFGTRLGLIDGVDLLRDRRVAGIKTILVCPDLDPKPLLAAVELGVDGVLVENASVEAVKACISTVADDRQWIEPVAMKVVLDHVAARPVDPSPTLTRRERDVAKLVTAGQRNRAIADALGISEGTVKMHLHNVYAKLGLESRTQLAMDERARAV